MGKLWCGDRETSAEAIRERALKAATGLESLGVREGDAVAFCLRNETAFFEVGQAAGILGAFPVALNWHCTLDEADYVLTDCGAQVLVIHADLLASLRSVVPEGVRVISVRTPREIAAAYGLPPEAGAPAPGDLEWGIWLEGFAPWSGEARQAPSTIIYTSGTTGRPKGVKRGVASDEQAQARTAMLLRSYGYADWMDRPQEIVTAVVGPIYHAAPNAHSNISVSIGANVVVMPRFDPEALLGLIHERRITHLNMAPIMFNRLVKLPQAVRDRYDLSSLRFVAHAAAPVSPPVKREMIDWWGPVINEYYGSTEMGNVTFCTAEEWLAHPGTVGKPMPNTVVRVVDAEGNDCPVGVPGEVLGRNLGSVDFTYHGDDAKRRRAEKFGLISPGDIGYFDADGFLHLCDRSSDMVISGGVNIYPAEIEAILLKMPGVADCAVFGIPDDEYGEALCAVVQPQEGQEIDPQEVKLWIRAQLAGFKVPREVQFSAALPREDSGKIFKRKLREPWWEGRERRI